MKIQDLITLNKIEVRPNPNGYRYANWMNNTKKKYKEKNGYCWEIPCHSQNESILLNYYEKDCVIAYAENRYLIAFLIRTRGTNFRAFCYLKDFLKSIAGTYTYTISNIYERKNILNVFNNEEEDVKIIEKEEYTKFIKSLILEGIE